uniref:SH3-containing GRB2-like protein 3-interacting protein 1 n=1 Tax=Anas platyrhynchos TaxID=8839 RepID=A0A8B9ZL35_ANAPL
MMEGLKKRTRKAFGIRKKEKDTDSTGSPDRDGIPLSPHPTEPPCHSKPDSVREGGKKNSKKSNGAPNGFYAEIDWDRYNSPELDEEGYSIRPEEPGSTRGKHFYSSSESEEEEEAHKKFNIKIKPLQAKDILKSAATVDELKASVGNIALSPSPVGTIKRNLSSEEIARPRRSTPTPDPSSRKPPEDPAALAPLFGPPLESAFEEQKLDAPLDQPEIWGSIQPPNSADSPKLPRPFPTGTPPPLPPKNVPATPPRTGSPLTVAPGSEQPAAEAKSDKVPSLNDLDSIFGPVLSPKSVAVHTGDKWVNFSDPSPENVTVAPRPREKAAVASSPPVGAAGSPVAEPPRALPSPLRLEELQKKALEQPKEENAEPAAASPKDFGPGQRATPPPPPPPTYRTVVSSPGPGASSGAGSPSGTSPTTRCVPGCPRALPPRLVLPPVPSPKLGGCRCPSPPLLCA